MEADFSGYATKANLKCSDGRTIMPDAFKHCDKMTVPLVWQHGHSEATNVLGHAILEARDDGIYAHGFFNETDQGQNAKKLVTHKDIQALSIYANQLIERSKQVFHGMIREVSLVLSGANPGALIDFVSIQHSGGDVQTLDDEAIIYTGLTLEHVATEPVVHAAPHPLAPAGEKTVKDIFDAMTKEQKDVVHYMLGAALEAAGTTSPDAATAKHDGMYDSPVVAQGDNGSAYNNSSTSTYTEPDGTATTTKSDSSSKNTSVTNADGSVTRTSIDGSVRTTTTVFTDGTTKTCVVDDSTKTTTTTTTNADGVITHQEGPTDMVNIFDQNSSSTGGTGVEKHVLSHGDIKGIVDSAKKIGSLRDAVDAYALAHGINDIDLLFPDAKLMTTTPEFNKRRTEWVSRVLGSTRHTPFSRVKTIVADITMDEARAKGYIKGNMKKEEWFGLTKRTTSPTTVYKKQALDRDDVLDITDFDIVAYLKGEMRLMLEEEVARAILIGDGRTVEDEDKIKDPLSASDGVGIRSISNDHDLFVTAVNVNVDDANSTYDEVVDGVMDAMEYYKGTGTPTFFTTIRVLNRFLQVKDTTGRRIYENKAAVASALGVDEIVTVEPMNDEDDMIGVIVNLTDYNVGADKGGEVSLFDDFDIDYNKQKYLIETRLSGALVKIKSALVVRKVAAGAAKVTPVKPTFDADTNTITFPTVTGVTYKVSGVTKTGTLVITDDTIVTVVPASGSYYFILPNTQWTFTYQG